MRSSTEAKIGDTLFKKGLNEPEPVASLKQSKPMVFAGVYPMDQSETPALRSALEKLTLNDASVTLAKESRYFFLLWPIRAFNHSLMNKLLNVLVLL